MQSLPEQLSVTHKGLGCRRSADRLGLGRLAVPGNSWLSLLVDAGVGDDRLILQTTEYSSAKCFLTPHVRNQIRNFADCRVTRHDTIG